MANFKPRIQLSSVHTHLKESTAWCTRTMGFWKSAAGVVCSHGAAVLHGRELFTDLKKKIESKSCCADWQKRTRLHKRTFRGTNTVRWGERSSLCLFIIYKISSSFVHHLTWPLLQVNLMPRHILADFMSITMKDSCYLRSVVHRGYFMIPLLSRLYIISALNFWPLALSQMAPYESTLI